MHILWYIIASTAIIGIASLVGIVTLSLKEKKLNKILYLLIALSAGTLMGAAFLHLLPEAIEDLPASFTVALIAFTGFFFVEKLLHWHHCRQGHSHEHTLGYMNLAGDAIHNFIDGLVVAATFVIDIRLGIITSIAIILHEIPHELGDFGVLLYSGFSVRRALLLNVLIAMTAVAGGVVGYFFSLISSTLIYYLLPVAAGGFIYIAASDLMPEIRKEENIVKSLHAFGMFVLGILIMYFTKLLGIA